MWKSLTEGKRSHSQTVCALLDGPGRQDKVVDLTRGQVTDDLTIISERDG